MATIKISDLQPVGTDLLSDSESYLNYLTDDELNLTKGGITPTLSLSSWGCAASIAYGVSYAWGRWGPRG